jgi:hypothetical protein
MQPPGLQAGRMGTAPWTEHCSQLGLLELSCCVERHRVQVGDATGS